MKKRMRPLWQMLLTLAVLSVFTATEAQAADQVVSDCGDNSGANQLRAKLAAAQSSGGGTITFVCSTPIALQLGVLPTITTNIVIEGGSGIVLDGGFIDGASRAFVVASNGTLTLNNVTIQNFFWDNGDGGAIHSNGTLNVNQSKFLNNETSPNWSGGAIVSYGPLNIINSEFGYNAGGGGGAVYPRHASVVTITDSSFHHNTTLNDQGGGGAILTWDGPRVTIEGSTFSSNSANVGGGAIYLTANSKLDISGSLFSDNASYSGGGIYLEARTATNIETTTLKHNRAAGGAGFGGGIYLDASATLTKLTISNNHADAGGGGIHSSGGDALVTLTNSTVSGNTSGHGGGISNYNGTLDATNVTISGNSAFQGGGIYGYSKLTNVTLVNNTGTEGSGIYHTFRSTTLKNTILSNTAPGGNCFVYFSAPPTSAGHNISSDNSCTPYLNQTGDHNNTNPLLGPLAHHGGFSQTHLPQPGSTAIDNGTNTGCPSTDQRGIPRPQDGDGNGSNLCDVGAVEIAALPTATSTHTRTATRTNTVPPTSTRTPTHTATRTSTRTPTRTATRTATLTHTATATRTATLTHTATATLTPTATTTTACGTPTKPVLTAPQNGATTIKTKVPLKWNAVSCATTYKVVVKQDSKKGKPVFSATVTATTKKTSALAKGHTYYWWVRACNASNQCTKSAVWSFRLP